MNNRFFHRALSFFVASVVIFAQFPLSFARAATVDLALSANNITFSTSTLYVGDTIRIYARVRNVGDTDATAYVLFFQGGMVIGASQVASLRANGNPDDVFVDFTVPNGTFNIRAALQGSSPQDLNPDNDIAITALFSPIADADRDGVIDEDDNCVNDVNTDRLDTDGDGKGDVCDTDDDNDSVTDANDPAPTDATITGISVPKPADVATPVATPATNTTTTATTTSSSSAPVPSTTSAPITESAAATTVEGVVAALSSSTSKLTTSPLARFTSKQIDWRTYEFTLAEQPEDGVRFGWDFGDGATSVQSKITHAFSGPGTYTVTLAILNADGTTLSDAQTYDVSFFHLDNPQVILLIGALLLAMFLCGFAFIKLRRSYDQGALHE